MVDNIKKILTRLDINNDGRYDNHFYVVDLKDSDDYARAYTKLSKNAINTEYPYFDQNSSNNTIKITNYFEIDEDSSTYLVFLIANFEDDSYYIKIGEK